MKKFVVFIFTITMTLLGSRSLFANNTVSMEDWSSAQMASWSPPGKSLYKDALETEEAGKTRYRSIARDAISVVYDPTEAPLFPGPYGRAKTLAVMLSVAHAESGFRKDVDTGKGPSSKGDGGRSWCLMQVQLGKAINGKTSIRINLKGDTVEYVYDRVSGWGGEDLISDRKACFRIGLHIMRHSFNSCKSVPLEDRLTAYTSGNCTGGRKSSRARIKKAVRWLASIAPPMTDDSVISSMTPGFIGPLALK